MRRNFSDILKSVGVSPEELYRNIVRLFYVEKEAVSVPQWHRYAQDYSLYDWCKICFRGFPFRRCTLSIDEFNQKYSFNNLAQIPQGNNEEVTDALIKLCEYVVNFLSTIKFPDELQWRNEFTLSYVEHSLKELLLVKNRTDDGIWIITHANPAIEAVSAVVDEGIAIQLVKYTHYSMEGNLDGKRKILASMAKCLESRRKEIGREAPTVTDRFFFGVNNFDIRHDNVSKDNPDYYKADVASLSTRELEAFYDRIFRLGLSLFCVDGCKDDEELLKSISEKWKKEH